MNSQGQHHPQLYPNVIQLPVALPLQALQGQQQLLGPRGIPAVNPYQTNPLAGHALLSQVPPTQSAIANAILQQQQQQAAVAQVALFHQLMSSHAPPFLNVPLVLAPGISPISQLSNAAAAAAAAAQFAYQSNSTQIRPNQQNQLVSAPAAATPVGTMRPRQVLPQEQSDAILRGFQQPFVQPVPPVSAVVAKLMSEPSKEPVPGTTSATVTVNISAGPLPQSTAHPPPNAGTQEQSSERPPSTLNANAEPFANPPIKPFTILSRPPSVTAASVQVANTSSTAQASLEEAPAEIATTSATGTGTGAPLVINTSLPPPHSRVGPTEAYPQQRLRPSRPSASGMFYPPASFPNQILVLRQPLPPQMNGGEGHQLTEGHLVGSKTKKESKVTITDPNTGAELDLSTFRQTKQVSSSSVVPASANVTSAAGQGAGAGGGLAGVALITDPNARAEAREEDSTRSSDLDTLTQSSAVTVVSVDTMASVTSDGDAKTPEPSASQATLLEQNSALHPPVPEPSSEQGKAARISYTAERLRELMPLDIPSLDLPEDVIPEIFRSKHPKTADFNFRKFIDFSPRGLNRTLPRHSVEAAVHIEIPNKKAGEQFIGRTENAWVPSVIRSAIPSKPEPIGSAHALLALQPEDALLKKQLTGILNKITPQKFRVLMEKLDHLLDSNNSYAQLKTAVDVIFEKAIDESKYAISYAYICHHCQHRFVLMADDAGKENVKEKEKKEKESAPNEKGSEGGAGAAKGMGAGAGTGAGEKKQLTFTQMLLGRCQHMFEKKEGRVFWQLAEKEAAVRDIEAERAKLEHVPEGEEEDDDALGKRNLDRTACETRLREARETLQEVRAKERRHALGNIKFIGELYKVDVVKSTILFHCFSLLITEYEKEAPPKDEQRLEVLVKLLVTVGKKLESDGREAVAQLAANAPTEQRERLVAQRERMPSLMKKMKEMHANAKQEGISLRLQYLLQDLLELAENDWVPRREDNAPRTIDQIHREAEQEERERNEFLNAFPMTRRSDMHYPAHLPHGRPSLQPQQSVPLGLVDRAPPPPFLSSHSSQGVDCDPIIARWASSGLTRSIEPKSSAAFAQGNENHNFGRKQPQIQAEPSHVDRIDFSKFQTQIKGDDDVSLGGSRRMQSRWGSGATSSMMRAQQSTGPEAFDRESDPTFRASSPGEQTAGNPNDPSQNVPPAARGPTS